MRKRVSLVFALSLMITSSGWAGSLRFGGTGSGDLDRVKVSIDGPPRSADVGLDFTLEWWMRATFADNNTPPCTAGQIGLDGWRNNANILFDRDVSGSGDFGEYGVSLRGGRIAFGVAVGGTGETLCGSTNVADNAWHHIAVTRRASDGQLRIFIDGNLHATGTGPTGDISYRDGRTPSSPNDPFLVIGAEKHDVGAPSFSYRGFLDEIRLSSQVRYAATFARPRHNLLTDASTVLLFHFDEMSGNRIFDESGAAGGPSHGVRQFTAAGPVWSTENPPIQIATQFSRFPLASTLISPVAIANAGDGTNRLFVVQQTGQIRIFSGGQLLPVPFLDIDPRVLSGNERGLLGLAFHPNYESNGLFYVYYTRDSAITSEDGDLVVSRFQVSTNPNVANPGSETIFLVIEHTQNSNHNGGELAFGPDGYLYIAPGDGGGGGDPFESGQRLDTLLGKMLRINVDVPATPFPYSIPPDNPFVGVGGALPEIWAFGLRNPWRFSFDRLVGDLYIGDVGQQTREEISFQPAASNGGENYGWDVLEGTFCHEDVPTGSCAALLTSSTLPIIEYGRSLGSTVTAGPVFRGRPNSILAANLLYADFGSGRIWRAAPNGSGTWTPTEIGSDPLISSFGQDENGGGYFADLGAGTLSRIAPYTFNDVLPTRSTWPFIEAIAEAGITGGCTTTTYCPTQVVTRAQMAIFLLRAKYQETHLPPPATGAVFGDVPSSHPAASWIEQLSAEGITAGCGGGNYCPDATVRRDQMAVFLLRTREGAGYTPPPCTGMFTDVPCSNFFAPWVEELARRNTTAGCGASTYCPADPVTREQMAVFIARMFGLPMP